MTKTEYLKRIETIVDTLDRITDNSVSISMSDAIQTLRLQFDIITAVYNCTKEND